MKLLVDASIADNEYLLPIGYDGEFFLPLGRGQTTKDSKTEIILERLPAPVSEGERSLQGSIRIFFQKVISQGLGRKFKYPILAVAEVGYDKKVTYKRDEAEVKQQVAQAKRIAVYIHGIIGDTESLVSTIKQPVSQPDGQKVSISELYDLVLTFDYENLNTTIEQNAQHLKQQLRDVGLSENHGKELHIIAHSMGGLVSRWFIERESGYKVVQHLIMLGTPNAGSPWPVVEDWVKLTLGIALNGLSLVAWSAKVLAMLVGTLETNIRVALAQMKPGSDFLNSLAASEDPGIPYSIIAGNTSIIPAALEQEAERASIIERLQQRLFKKVVEFPFFGTPNDLAVKVDSIKSIPTGRSLSPDIQEVACDHLSYFSVELTTVGLEALVAAITKQKARVCLPITDKTATKKIFAIKQLSQELKKSKPALEKLIRNCKNPNGEILQVVEQLTLGEELLDVDHLKFTYDLQQSLQNLFINHNNQEKQLIHEWINKFQERKQLHEYLTRPIDDLSKALKQETYLTTIIQSWNSTHANTKLLLPIDQFEELITLCKSDEEREQFQKLIKNALTRYPDSIHVVITLRLDFEALFQTPVLQDFWNEDTRFVVQPMTQDELREAIEKPASEKVVYFDPPSLVDILINEVVQMPGALPLLSFTLSELYLKYLKERRDNRALTKNDYEELGRVVGSIRNRANQEYDKLVAILPTYEHTVRRVMLRMISLQGGELARRQVPKLELVYPDKEENDRVQTVIKYFSKARLIVEGSNTQGEPYVEPAHDSLVQGWDKILIWKNQDLDNILLQRLVTSAAREWSSHEKADGFLWKNNLHIVSLKKVLESENNWLNQMETEFVKASRRVAAEERAKEQAQRAKILADINPVVSLLSAIEATCLNLEYNKVENEEEKKIISPILDSLRYTIKTVRERSRYHHESAVLSVAISPNGQWFVTGSFDGKLRIWDINGNCIRKTFIKHKTLVNSVAISSDGEIIVSGSDDGILCLWNLEGELICEPIKSEQSRIHSIVINPNGQWFISGGSDGSLRQWDMKGNLIDKILTHQEGINSINISADGQLIISGSDDKTLIVLDLQNKKNIHESTEEEEISSVAISHNHKWIASGSSKGTLSLLNLQSKGIKSSIRVEGKVSAVAFSPDGQWLAACGDSTIILHNLVSERLENIGRHQQPITSIVFSPDGQLIMSASYDCTVRLWSIQGNYAAKELASNTEQCHKKRVNSVEFLSEQIIASISNDGTIRFWDLEGRLVSKSVEIGPVYEADKVYSLAVSSDRKWIVTSGETLSLWRLNINEELQLSKDENFRKSKVRVQAVAFSPDGKRIVTSGLDRTLHLWDLEGNSVSQPFKGHKGLVNSIAFSPDGQLIASGSDDGALCLWNLTGQLFKELFDDRHGSRVNSVAFSPDGQLIASGHDDGKSERIK